MSEFTPRIHVEPIVFMAPEEPTYLPVFFERVVTALGDKVAAIVVVSPIYKGSTWLSQGIRFTKSFGLRVFILEGVFFAYYTIGLWTMFMSWSV